MRGCTPGGPLTRRVSSLHPGAWGVDRIKVQSPGDGVEISGPGDFRRKSEIHPKESFRIRERLAAPGFETAETALPPPSGVAVEIHDVPVARRAGEPAAAAYVCCNGDGGFTICRGQSGGNALLQRCVDEHERDHLAWFAEHLSEACAGQPRGSCRFAMTPHEFRELVCRGYRAEFRCLSRPGPVTGSELGELLWRRYVLLQKAKSRFAVPRPARCGRWSSESGRATSSHGQHWWSKQTRLAPVCGSLWLWQLPGLA